MISFIVRKRSGSSIVADINKDLDFSRKSKTDIPQIEESKEEHYHELDKDNFKVSIERKGSELTTEAPNPFKFNFMNKVRKATEDEGVLRKTGYFVNAQESNHQSSILEIANNKAASENLQRTEE